MARNSADLPVFADGNYFGHSRSPALEGTDMLYEYMRHSSQEAFTPDFTTDTKDREGIVIKEETDDNRGLFHSFLPWGGSNDQKAYRVRVKGDDDFIPFPCDFQSPEPASRGIIEQHKLYFCDSDIDISVGDVVFVNYLLGANQIRQSIGVIARKMAGSVPPPPLPDECNTLEQRMAAQAAQGNTRPLGSESSVGASNSYPVIGEIDELLPSIRPVIRRIVQRMNAEGFDARVFETLRDPRRAEALKNEGYSSVGRNSMHVYRVAVDIISRSKQWFQNEPSPDEAGAPFWYKLGEIAEDEGFVWGGRWTNGAFSPSGDRPHIQAVAVNEQSRARSMSDEERDEFAYQSIQRRRGSSAVASNTRGNTSANNRARPAPLQGEGTGGE